MGFLQEKHEVALMPVHAQGSGAEFGAGIRCAGEKGSRSAHAARKAARDPSNVRRCHCDARPDQCRDRSRKTSKSVTDEASKLSIACVLGGRRLAASRTDTLAPVVR